MPIHRCMFVNSIPSLIHVFFYKLRICALGLAQILKIQIWWPLRVNWRQYKSTTFINQVRQQQSDTVPRVYVVVFYTLLAIYNYILLTAHAMTYSGYDINEWRSQMRVRGELHLWWLEWQHYKECQESPSWQKHSTRTDTPIYTSYICIYCTPTCALFVLPCIPCPVWMKCGTTCLFSLSIQVVTDNRNPYWVGASDTIEEGVWRWVSTMEGKLDYTNWIETENPDNDDFNCLSVSVMTAEDGKWHRDMCGNPQPAVCEVRLVSIFCIQYILH